MVRSNRSSMDLESVSDSPSTSDTTTDYQLASEDESFPYSPLELSTIFSGFCQALTTLHFDPSELKPSPPNGWPQMTPEFLANFKSPEVMAVLRVLPYFNSRKNIQYKSKFIDFSTKSQVLCFETQFERMEGRV